MIKNTPLTADKPPIKVLRNPRLIIATEVPNSKSRLSGEVAIGKSQLVRNITLCTPVCNGKSEDYFGAVIKTLPTECASYNIRGYTWHSALRTTPLVDQRSLQVVE